jgi:hypothetical protein
MTDHPHDHPHHGPQHREHTRLFLDGADATTFLAQHREMVDGIGKVSSLIERTIAPQMVEAHTRLGSIERNIERSQIIAIEERAEVARLARRVAAIEDRRFGRIIAAVALVLCTSAATAGASYYLSVPSGSRDRVPSVDQRVR